MHRELVLSINSDRRGEHKSFDIVIYSRIDEVYTPDEVVLVVKSFDEMAEPFRCISGEVIDIVELVLFTELIYEGNIKDASLHKGRSRIEIFLETPAQVVKCDNFRVLIAKQFIHDVRAHKACAASNQ